MIEDPVSENVVRAWVRLVKVGQAMLRDVEAELRRKGFPPLAWYDVLLELSRESAEGMRPSEIEQRLLLAQHNVSRLIDRLVKTNYVERRPCPGDGRGLLVAITPTGQILLERMWPPYRSAIQRHVGEQLTAQDAAMLASILSPFLAKEARY